MHIGAPVPPGSDNNASWARDLLFTLLRPCCLSGSIPSLAPGVDNRPDPQHVQAPILVASVRMVTRPKLVQSE